MATSSSKQPSETVQPADPTIPKSQTKRPIWEVGAQISDEDWAKVPNDGSINYKHYLYGVPKQDTCKTISPDCVRLR